MAEGSVPLIKPLKVLRRLKNFPCLEGSVIQCLLEQASQFIDISNLQNNVTSLNSATQEVHKWAVVALKRLLILSKSSSSKYVEFQKKVALLFRKLLILLKLLEICYVTISSKVFTRLSRLSRGRLRSLSSLEFIWTEEFSWPPKFGDLRSLPSLYEDGVNNRRSNDGVSPFRGEDNHVSSGNNEGKRDDHCGSNDVSARLISVSDGGGIEEPERRAGETPGPSIVISHGTDGLESFVQSLSSFEGTDGGLETFVQSLSSFEDRVDNVRLISVPDGGGIEEPEHRAGETPGPSTVITHGTNVLESSVRSLSSFEDRVDNARLISVPDGGGIEEQECRAGETLGPSTVISHGTDGLESFVQSLSSFEDRVDNVRLISVPISVPDGGGIEEPERRAGETPGPSTVISHGTNGLESSVQSLSSFEDRVDNARLISVPDGGGIEKPEHRAGETPGPSTVIAHGTNGLESSVRSLSSFEDRVDNARLISVPDGGGIEEQECRAGKIPGPDGINGVESFVESVIEQWLRDQDVNLDSLKTIFENFNVKDLLTTDPSFNIVLTQKMNNVCMDLSRVLETNSELSSEELKEYYHPICWNSTKRLEFLCRLSDRLLLKAKAPDQQDELKVFLSKELESKKPLVSDGGWIDKMDPKFRPRRQYDKERVGALLRFVRNQWRHLPDEFEEFLGLGSAERFYNFFHAQFPKLLVVSYGAASRFCREEKWFEEYRGRENPLGHFP